VLSHALCVISAAPFGILVCRHTEEQDLVDAELQQLGYVIPDAVGAEAVLTRHGGDLLDDVLSLYDEKGLNETIHTDTALLHRCAEHGIVPKPSRSLSRKTHV
jgi:hypothetical protein